MGDESIVYQQMFALQPESPQAPSATAIVLPNQAQIVDTVPRFEGEGLSEPIATYQGAGRSRRDALPDVVVNPRATLPYGADSLRFYVEGYDLPVGTHLAARVIDPDSVVLWSATVAVRFGGFAPVAFVLNPSDLPVGRAAFEVKALEIGARVASPFLVTFSDQWAIANFAEMVDVLRFFPRQDLVTKLKAAPREQRAQAWRDFYQASDPVPITPENEALEQYFHRVEIASVRFPEPGIPGWRTERGEVFIALGEPDAITESPNQVSAGMHLIQWDYLSLRVTLVFEDDAGFGEYRLTPLSRSDFQRVVARVRREQ